MKKIAAIFAAFIAAFSCSYAYAQSAGQPISGYDYVNSRWRPVYVDPNGKITIIGSGVGGNVFGTDSAGTAAVHAPLVMAGVNTNFGSTGGTIYQWHID